MIIIQEFLSRLSSAAEGIRSMEERRKALADFLKGIKDEFSGSPDFMEEKLVHRVSPQDLSGKKILAVDGGLSHHSYQGIELALLRAIAVLFQYGNSEKPDVAYYPNSAPNPKMVLLSDPCNDGSLDISNERQREEIETAIGAAKKFSPDIVLMDGMIVPHMNDIPKENSGSRGRFVQTVKSFNSLYGSNRGLLAGCVEDSRGKRFCEILSKNKTVADAGWKDILAAASDTGILHYLLDCGERTCAFRFSGDGLINILGDEGRNIYSFYMKTAKFDRPLRVDFYCKNPEHAADTAEKVSSLILSSCCNDVYGFPAPLIEADFRARLSEGDVEKLHDQLVDRVGAVPPLMKLRRELRPL